MKQIFIILILVICSVLFCSCGNAVITCSLNKDNTAQMKTELIIPKGTMSNEEFENAYFSLSLLERYLSKEGYDTKVIKSEDSIELNIVKQARGKSSKEGFEMLLDMMKDETSPFSYVEGGYSQSYFEDIYNLGANVDLTKIVDYEYVDTLPKSQKNKVFNALEGFSGTVIFDLEGELTEHTGTVHAGKNSAEFDSGEPVQIKSVLTVKNTENIQNYEKLKAEINLLEGEKSDYTQYLVIASCIIVILLAVMLIVLTSRKTKHSGRQTNP